MHRCCCGGERRDRLALRLWRTQCMMCEAAHTMRVVPRGTRGTVRTSPRRLNEASPKLSMTVGEQLPPARTVAGSAGGQGSTVFVQPGGLTLRESDDRRRDVHGYALSSSAFCPQLNPERDRGGEEQQSSANSHALWLPPCKATLTERFQWQRGDAVAAGLSLYARLLCSMPGDVTTSAVTTRSDKMELFS